MTLQSVLKLQADDWLMVFVSVSNFVYATPTTLLNLYV